LLKLAKIPVGGHIGIPIIHTMSFGSELRRRVPRPNDVNEPLIQKIKSTESTGLVATLFGVVVILVLIFAAGTTVLFLILDLMVTFYFG
jgi:hypothetical protein